jgi:hypothetical protein
MVMDSKETRRPAETPRGEDGAFRLSRRMLPLASVVGAFGVVAAAVLRPSVEVPVAAAAPTPAPGPAGPAPVAPAPGLPQNYSRAATVVGPGLPGEFRQSLTGVAVGPRDTVYALGDGEVRVFEPAGKLARAWKAPDRASCIGVALDGRVAVGSPGRVDLYGESGAHVGGFAVGTAGKPAAVTTIRFVRDSVLVADATAKVIRRYDTRGNEQGVIGAQNKTGGFMLPNRCLDFDVDATGVVHAADTGRHQVTSWTLDGAPVASFGKFGLAKAEDFVGCCNPVNVAVAPDGSVVTAEKVAARVKVYGKDRALLAVIGPEHFDRMCTHIHVAVDSTGRIVAADPERRTVAVFGRV